MPTVRRISTIPRKLRRPGTGPKSPPVTCATGGLQTTTECPPRHGDRRGDTDRQLTACSCSTRAICHWLLGQRAIIVIFVGTYRACETDYNPQVGASFCGYPGGLGLV